MRICRRRIFHSPNHASANNPNPYGDDDYATPTFDEEEVIEEPNEPLEENNPTPVEVKPPTAKGGIRIR